MMGSRWARLVRWLGLDRNPLRRPADRIESALRIVVLILLLGVPVAAVSAGRTADHLALHRMQAQRSEEQLARATLTRKATGDTGAHPYSSVPVAWVAARWTAADGSVHRGEVLAQVGARPGSIVLVWIDDRSGAVTDPPMGQTQVRVDVALAVMAVAELLPMLLIALFYLGRHLLDVRRRRAWDTDWGITGPQWRRNRAP